jgi:hypothetical protein
MPVSCAETNAEPLPNVRKQYKKTTQGTQSQYFGRVTQCTFYPAVKQSAVHPVKAADFG